MRAAMRAALRAVLLLAPPMLAVLPAAAAGRPVAVELFTSQSRSSCPPAEALPGDHAGRGGDVLPLAFHVTYWNGHGWRDTVSLPAATDRQAAYAASLGETGLTPRAVVDGRRSVVGSRRGEVAAAIGQARAKAREAAPVSLSRRGGELAVSLGTGSGMGSGSGSVTLVGFDRTHTTAVARGENAGRTIAQANIVRSVRSIGRWTGAAQTLSTPLPQETDAAVIVQAPDGRVLGAARLGPSS